MAHPEKNPVIVWFEGGPGCSSMAGVFHEHGPFLVGGEDVIIRPNPNSLNHFANVLYIESPAGVGFTYAKRVEDITHNDLSVTLDAFSVLSQFFVDFPEYVGHKLYIAGSSYGGIYAPNLSLHIHNHNQKALIYKDMQTYNLKGFIVGNGVTDWSEDVFAALPETLAEFNLISYDMSY